MKKKLIAGLIAFAVAITGVQGTPFSTAMSVKADETPVSYSVQGHLGDKDEFRELAVGDVVHSYSDFVGDDGSALTYGEEWAFVEDSVLKEMGAVTLFYSAYDNAEDAQQDRVDFDGEIPAAAFGKYVYKMVFVYTIPENQIAVGTIRSDYPITSWVEKQAYTVAKNDDDKTVSVFSIWKSDRTDVSFVTSVKVDGKSYKVNAIGDYALETTSLTKVTLHSGITSVGKGAFREASKLKTIIINGDLKQVGEGAFADVNPKATFKIKASKAKYDKIVKRIKKSGVPKTVKFKRVK